MKLRGLITDAMTLVGLGLIVWSIAEYSPTLARGFLGTVLFVCGGISMWRAR